MKIYKTYEIELINKTTGMSITRKERQEVETRCDYSGLVIDEMNSKPYCSYNLDYGYQDSLFGDGDDESELSQLGVDIFDFLSQPYEFYDDSYSTGEYFNQETKMLEEATSLFSENDLSIESVLRYVRTRTALKLIKDGIIEPEDLNRRVF